MLLRGFETSTFGRRGKSKINATQFVWVSRRLRRFMELGVIENVKEGKRIKVKGRESATSLTCNLNIRVIGLNTLFKTEILLKREYPHLWKK